MSGISLGCMGMAYGGQEQSETIATRRHAVDTAARGRHGGTRSMSASNSSTRQRSMARMTTRAAIPYEAVVGDRYHEAGLAMLDRG